jgi:hypothetical protein
MQSPQDWEGLLNKFHCMLAALAGRHGFVWSSNIIGVVLAATMFILLVVANTYSPITGIICFICLIFLFFESAFGICLGCKFYTLFYKEKAQYCPGEVCDVKSRQDIQKTSIIQILIIFAFIAYIFITVFLFDEYFRERPYDLFGIENAANSK